MSAIPRRLYRRLHPFVGFAKWVFVALPSVLAYAQWDKEGLGSYLESHLWLAFLLAFGPALGLGLEAIQRRWDRAFALDGDLIAYLLLLFNDAVGYKARELERRRNEGKRSHDRSSAEQQIEKLSEAFYHFFCHDARVRATSPDGPPTIRVVLAEMRERRIVRYAAAFPADQPPRSDVSILRGEESGFSRAADFARPLVVADIRREGRKPEGRRHFIVTSPDRRDEEGSMICLPIVHGGDDRRQVPFVLALRVDRPNYFREAEIERYKVVFDGFATRFKLEYSTMIALPEVVEDGDHESRTSPGPREGEDSRKDLPGTGERA